MDKIRTLIADDIEQFNELLEMNLEKYCPQVEVIAMATDLEETYTLIKTKKPDLVILDVEFGGPTSFDLLKKLKDENAIDFQIIFLTAYTESSYITRAFRYSALQYLFKPVDNELLTEAINLAYEGVFMEKSSQIQEQVDMMINNLSKPITSPDREIMLKLIRKTYQKIRIDSILYLMADSPMTDVFLTDGNKIKTVELIGQYDNLTADYDFFRISQSCIVNLNHATSYQATDRTITLKNGTVLTTSRQRDKELRRWFGI